MIKNWAQKLECSNIGINHKVKTSKAFILPKSFQGERLRTNTIGGKLVGRKKSSSPKKEKVQKIKGKDEIHKLFVLYKKTKDPAIREELILNHLNLVINLAQRFANRGEPLKDLVQVGNLGLIQAIDRFDIKRGVEFATYATPTILGEIKRYFRDKGWAIKVPRRLQELNSAIVKSIEQLTQDLKRSPKILEIARHLEVSEEEVLEALELGQAYNPISLDAEIFSETDEYPPTLLDLAGRLDKEIEGFGDRKILKEAVQCLSHQERLIIYWRFFKNQTQIEIAKRLKISQMQVSRLQREALRKMRIYILRSQQRNENY